MSRAGWTVVSLGIVAALGMIGVMTGGLSGAGAMRSSRTTTAGAEEWKAQIASLDRALGANDVGQAMRAWRDAYGAALGSRRWEPMFAVGQAALRIGGAAETLKGHDEKARHCYLMALFRARQQKSVDGVLLVAEAFADLGDIEVASRAIDIAGALTRRYSDDGQAPERAASIRDRLRSPSAAPRDAPPPRRRQLGDLP
jgi:hypothetical protein